MGRKILLVEDDRETAAYLAKGLTQEGHRVEQATNGQDGLFRATDGSFDLVILDRMLPALDGVSVLKALRAARIETPVLILSALASVGDRIEGLEHGSDDYLVKPFSFAELLARVNALLRRREARLDPADHRLKVGDLDRDPLSPVVGFIHWRTDAQLLDAVEDSLPVAAGLAALLGLACGAIVAKYVDHRIKGIVAVTNRITARDLSQRIPLAGTGDAFDRLGLQI